MNDNTDVFDVAVIGSGPAGISAALTLNAHNKSIVWFGTDMLSNKVEKSEMIANYAGCEMISGPELNSRFRSQIRSAGLELTDRMVTQVSKYNEEFMLLAANRMYKAKTVLFAIGTVPDKGVKNELELLGHGVSYCATCDGFFYKGRSIAVFCSSKRYEHEVEYLAEIAHRVYLFANYKDIGIKADNVEFLDKPIKAVVGDRKVDAVRLTDDSVIAVDGVFFLRNAVAPTTILKGLQMDGPHIAVNRDCCTNIPGCFAAGDCTGRPYQIAKAVGEGNVAAHKITEFLANKRD